MSRRLVRISRSLCAAFVVVACAGLSPACRDGVAPFEKTRPEPETGPVRRLTWNPLSDEDPTWSATGDTLYYTTAAGFFDFPRYPRTILRIPSAGGDVQLLSKRAQFDETAREIIPAIGRPVLSPDGSKIAYLEFRCTPCTNCVTRTDCTVTRLDFVMLRVRDVGSNTHAYNDPGIRIDPAPGTFRGSDYGVSWSHDGQRIVFSDQSELRVWHTRTDVVDVIPNTSGAMSPAWSPADDVIAFSRRNGTGARRLQVVTLDGAVTDVGEGIDPAWSIEGSHIYFSANGGIKKMALSTGAVEPVAGAEKGRMPSLSRDGHRLAVARPQVSDTTSYDIYVIDIAGGQQ